MKGHDLLLLPYRFVSAFASAQYAAKRGLVGFEFYEFGRRLGWALLRAGRRSALQYLLRPVSSTRFFEFAFAESVLMDLPGECLDVGSPSLFSLYVAEKGKASSILMINPDCKDVSHTSRVIHDLSVNGIRLDCCGVETLSTRQGMYDCIWSISVVEHIPYQHGDAEAVQLMYDALRPGGRLILTVPVDRLAWDEYRDTDYYGTQGMPSSNGKFFFQRLYDKTRIYEKLMARIEHKPSVVCWFGETTPGIFADYIRQWMRRGYWYTLEDPRHIVDHYREFNSWEEMPGAGVCGLMVEKPAGHPDHPDPSMLRIIL